MTNVTEWQEQEEVTAERLNEVWSAMRGTAGKGRIMNWTALSLAGSYAAIFRNQGSDGLALKIENSSGTAIFTATNTAVSASPDGGTTALAPLVTTTATQTLTNKTLSSPALVTPTGLYGVRAYKSASVHAASSVASAIPFSGSQRWEVGSMHNESTNTTRLVAPAAGVYLVFGHASFVYHASGGYRSMYFQKTEATGGLTRIFAADQRMAVTTASEPTQISLASVINLAANDYVEVFVKSEVAVNVTQSTGSSGSTWYTCEAGMVLVGGTT